MYLKLIKTILGSELNINVVIDGQDYTQEQLEVIQYERGQHVLHEVKL
ncbi:hypothetical protein ACQKD9_07950 [Bacillus paramycoides]|nr:hypothetical protein [Bacillus paramycoides]